MRAPPTVRSLDYGGSVKIDPFVRIYDSQERVTPPVPVYQRFYRQPVTPVPPDSLFEIFTFDVRALTIIGVDEQLGGIMDWTPKLTLSSPQEWHFTYQELASLCLKISCN